ncbi:MAG TPA: FAD-dependent oxidoreductase [Planctomycetota bacterium]|mgnify:FL=1|nr:FAD-dependent oxidoreductase [Planctomycetota bacterium]HRR80344.1 FAD-dependent oxidoreductase [Planctomycetota bacterium]HRT97422.1 FAD-dependent oxidoreductase [Planctomycetota bacterium]
MNFVREYDVVVAGAGVAGAAAALEAARGGRSVALVEKTILVGGLATTGLVNVYLPLCDGCGTQVTFGIAEEFLHLSARYGPGEVPPAWREGQGRYLLVFNPASFVLALDEALGEAGVDLWLDTLVCAPAMTGDRLVGLEVENKSGRGLLRARCVVDATGDADVSFRAGAECAPGENWLSIWALQASLDAARRAVEQGGGAPLLDAVRLGGDDAGRGAPPGRAWDGTRGRDVSRFVLETRRMLREHYRARQAERGAAGRCDVFPLTLPAMAQFRTTRRIVGHSTLADGQHGQRCAESVGLVADWRKAAHVWEVPYGTLLPRRVRGLLAAGRCMAAAGDAWQVMRVIPPAALTGQAAGLAAAMAAERDTTPDALDPGDVQRALRGRAIPLHLDDVGL